MDKVAFFNSQVACALIEAMGMHAENQQFVSKGEQPVYLKVDFDALIVRYDIGHNAAIEWLKG